MENLVQSTSGPASPAPQLNQLNAVFDLGNAEGKLRASPDQAINFRSILAPLSTANKMGEWPTADVIFFNSEWWVAGESAYIYAPEAVQENTTVTRYTSSWYRTLFAFALHKVFHSYAGSGVLKPRIISSIPAEIYKDQSQTHEIKAKLTGRYDILTVSGKMLEIEVEPRKFNILPEGIGTYFERVYGQPDGKRYRKGTWGIGDLGYLTYDMVFMRNEQYVPTLSKSDEHTGFSQVAGSIRDYIFQKRRVRLSRSEIDAAMMQDEISVNGTPINIVEVRTKGLVELGKRVAMLTEQWTSGLNLEGLILTGGGTTQTAPHIHLGPTFPVLELAGTRSNVDGAYLYLTQPKE